MNLCVCRKEVVLPAFICGVAVSCAVLLEGLLRRADIKQGKAIYIHFSMKKQGECDSQQIH